MNAQLKEIDHEEGSLNTAGWLSAHRFLTLTELQKPKKGLGGSVTQNGDSELTRSSGNRDSFGQVPFLLLELNGKCINTLFVIISLIRFNIQLSKLPLFKINYISGNSFFPWDEIIQAKLHTVKWPYWFPFHLSFLLTSFCSGFPFSKSHVGRSVIVVKCDTNHHIMYPSKMIFTLMPPPYTRNRIRALWSQPWRDGWRRLFIQSQVV